MPSYSGGRGAGAARGAAAAAVLVAIGVAVSACGGRPSEPPLPPPGAVPAGQPIGSGAIVGRVTFAGPPPPRKPIRMTSEAACHRPGVEALTEEVVVAPDGALRNVLVHVVSGLGERRFAPPAAPAVMDQAGCRFVPHLLGVQANQIVTFANSDPVLHNVRADARRNRAFNLAMPATGRTVRRFFSEPEVVPVRCDLHAWMSASIAVESHPFFQVTAEDGAFRLQGLPPGEYVVEAWHETLGTRRETVTLADGERREVAFTFAARSSP
jgi:plastocyanin